MAGQEPESLGAADDHRTDREVHEGLAAGLLETASEGCGEAAGLALAAFSLRAWVSIEKLHLSTHFAHFREEIYRYS